MKEKIIKSFIEDKKSLRNICLEENLTLKVVLECLSQENLIKVHDGSRAKELFSALEGKEEFNFIIEKCGFIFEIKSIFPKASESHGYFNLSHKAPLSGHFKLENIKTIVLVDEFFFGKRSCSWLILDENFKVIFKIYVSRDEKKEHKKEQLALFESWKV